MSAVENAGRERLRRLGLYRAPVALSSLEVGDRGAFLRECGARHDSNRQRWLDGRELPPLNRMLDRITGK